MSLNHALRSAGVAGAALLSVLGVAPVASAADLKPSYNFLDAIARGQAKPNGSPPGTNDWSCKPTSAHPRPIVLVHGTGANMNLTWRAFGPELKNRGYCVFALNYGKLGGIPAGALAPIDQSARQLATFVDKVLAATGAAKVDMAGHSQGGMMPRQYLRFEGGAAKVGTLVGFSPSNHGSGEEGDEVEQPTAPAWLESALRQISRGFCPACADQSAGSPFLTRLNADRETEPGVRYVVIQTRYDQIVTPWTSALLTGDNVKNIVVQDGCEIDKIDHAAIVYDRRAVAMALRELDPNDTTPVPCARTKQWVGG
ncbi:MAG: alpha/beta fold hydrolase [Solirubrobacteraceae bacterium]|nr:alpha/beta fold hydrolase [Solirubrobacteraceae bacterium]